ncbi:hypothetical protein PGTUg99_035394 [Puccinia graminis f. sp. tritici]|uniref:Uncharacterized protein n=1 Tax=Puccinia graminis f. sp. tritici TaxID=56615 RepID=A0A5B0RIM3_PUCGR|nr:hypothetical protein PGTUg99_035394 [Puccinia graminis f. sp. tritici]
MRPHVLVAQVNLLSGLGLTQLNWYDPTVIRLRESFNKKIAVILCLEDNPDNLYPGPKSSDFFLVEVFGRGTAQQSLSIVELSVDVRTKSKLK